MKSSRPSRICARSAAAYLLATLFAVAALLVSHDANAQTWPADSAFVAEMCGSTVSFDPVGDASGSANERDIIGTPPNAAVYYTNDGTFLYLRQRVAANPLRMDGTYTSYGWGWEINTDANLSTYEYLIMLDGIANPDVVTLQHNTITTRLNDPGDVSEVGLRSYPATTNARVSVAGTTIGGDVDYYVTVAVPIADLIAAGVPLGYTAVWTGTSPNANALQGDLACWNNATNPTLSGVGTGPVIVGVAVAITSPTALQVVNTARPAITGTSAPGQVVTITIDGVVAGTTTTAANGTWTFTPATGLSNALHTVVASVTDSGGHTATATVTFTVLAIAPSLVITAPANGSFTNDNTPTVTGSTDPGATLTISIDGGAAMSVTVDAMGNFTFTTSALADGSHTVTAVATRAGRNTTAMVTFTVDTTPPPITIVSPANGSRINDPSPAISGTSDPGATISVSVDGGMPTTVTADGTGAWSASVPATLTDGMHMVSVTATDRAGNTASAMSTFTVDTVAPALAITSPANGSLINNPSPAISGTSEAGAIITVSVDGSMAMTTADASGNWSVPSTGSLSDGPHTVVATARDAAGNLAMVMTMFTVDATAPALTITSPANGSTTANGSVTISGTTDPNGTVSVTIDGGAPQTATADASGAWTLGAVDFLNGPHTIVASATDAAGNNSSATSTFTVNVPLVPVTITSPTDGSTLNTASVTVVGTALGGATVTVSVDGTVSGTATASAGGAWTFGLTGLTDGTHVISARTTDAMGRTSTASVSVTIDTIAPVLTITSPTNGSLTRNPRPTITGTSDPNQMLTLSIDGGSAINVTADAAGAWSFTPAANLSDGTHMVRVDATDSAGNSSNATVMFTVDATPPVLTITSPTSGSVTNQTRPAITGTTDPNGTVSVSIDGGAATDVTADATGAWTFTPATALTDGTHTVTASATDAAGNNSTAMVTFTVNSAAPALAITFPADGASINNASPVITGTSDPGATIALVIDGGTPTTVTADGTGNWSFTVTTAFTDGMHTVRASTTSAGGTTTTVTTNFTVDTAAPTVAITSPADGAMVNSNVPAITGTAEIDSTVVVSIDGNTPVAVTVDATGSWSLTPSSPLAEGTHSVLARATDAAGNSANAMSSFTVDTVAPTLTITSPSSGSSVGTGTPPVTGTADPGATITITVDGGTPATVTADATGAWSFTITTALGNGSHTITASTNDAANNNTTVSTTFTVDTNAPSIAITSPANGSSVNTGTPNIFGTAPGGATVTLVIDGGTPVMVTADAGGNWTFTPGIALTDGMHMVTASTTNALGNTGMATSTFTVDTVAPVLTITAPANGSTTVNRMPMITGTADPGADVVVTIDTDAPVTVTADSMGAWSLTPGSPLGDGMHTIHATSTDAAGNMSTANSTFTVNSMGCTLMMGCAGTTPVCDPMTGLCHGCTSDADCSGATPACAPTGECVQCTTSMMSLCTGTTMPVCGDMNTCVECTATMHDACLPTGNGSACLSNDRCGCTNDTECSADRMCDVLMARCVAREADAGVDAGTDASVDSGSDAGDAGRDAGDAGRDAGDAGSDAGVDSGPRDGGDAGTTFSLTGNGACGCAVPGSPTRAPWSIGALLAVGAVLASRRRRVAGARRDVPETRV